MDGMNINVLFWVDIDQDTITIFDAITSSLQVSKDNRPLFWFILRGAWTFRGPYKKDEHVCQVPGIIM